jgi:transcriptional regulator with XRE-family HTH domain
MKKNFTDILKNLCYKDPNFRKKNGTFNATKAAKILKINQATLHRLLNGYSDQPRPDNIEKLTDYFKVTTDQLMGKKPLEVDDHTNSPVVQSTKQSIVERRYEKLRAEQQELVLFMMEKMIGQNKID